MVMASSADSHTNGSIHIPIWEHERVKLSSRREGLLGLCETPTTEVRRKLARQEAHLARQAFWNELRSGREQRLG